MSGRVRLRTEPGRCGSATSTIRRSPESTRRRCKPGPTLEDPVVRSTLAAAARLSGPQRYLTCGQLDLEIARNAAPWIAYANRPFHEFFSARAGCQTYDVYGLDLARLCIRHPTR